MTRLSRQGAGESGFTLLEILVGLLVSVLIMTGLTAAMRSVNRGWQSTVDALGRQDLIANGLTIVAGDVARIERIGNKPDAPDRFLFLGGPSETIFPLSERPASNKDGLYWIKLLVRSDDTGSELVRFRVPFESRDQDMTAVEWGDPVVLLNGKFTMGFAYRAPHGGFADWSSTWAFSNRIPEQISFSILDQRTGVPVLPPLVQAVGNDAEADCVDARLSGCTIQTKGELVPKKP